LLPYAGCFDLMVLCVSVETERKNTEKRKRKREKKKMNEWIFKGMERKRGERIF